MKNLAIKSGAFLISAYPESRQEWLENNMKISNTIKMKNNQYELADKLSLEEVFKEIKNHLDFPEKKVKIKVFFVNVQRLRKEQN